MSQVDVRFDIRSKIRPFPRMATYLTGWGGRLTFEQIASDITPRMANKLSHFGMYGQDIPDSIQTGLMRLWQRLVDEPELLANDSLLSATWRTLAISKQTTLAKQNRKYLPFTDIACDSGLDVDEYGISGYGGPNQAEPWASWAADVDFRLDITQAMQTIAEDYADDIKGLVALYILTTSVESQAALRAHNLAHTQVYERMSTIRARLQHLLKDYAPRPPRSWRDRLESGEVEPYLRVVEHYEDRPLALFALYTLTTCAHVRKFARDEKERKMISYYRKKCLKRIEAAYGQAASF